MGKARENASMASDESQSKKEVIQEAQREERTVHFAALMDICHLKNSELGPQFQKYKGRAVLRGHKVKDDTDSYVVFTEQGSSASQMTPAKVMDVIGRLPRCAGQAAGAASVYTHVKMEEAPALLKIPKSKCPDFWIRTSRYKRQNLGPVWKTQSFLLNETCMLVLLHDILRERQVEKILTDGKKFHVGTACLWIDKKDCYCLCTWTR